MISINRQKIIIAVIATFLLVFPYFSFAAQFMVTRVIDGDTVKARSISKEITIRLVGIDAPEASRKKNEPGAIQFDIAPPVAPL
jgi:endonuclease YncB( thermonuclease family)